MSSAARAIVASLAIVAAASPSARAERLQARDVAVGTTHACAIVATDEVAAAVRRESPAVPGDNGNRNTGGTAVDATDRVLTPGLISTHAHISGSPLDRSFIEDCGNPQFWFSGLFEMLPVRSDSQDEEAGRACVDFSMAELLRGVRDRFLSEAGLKDGAIVKPRIGHRRRHRRINQRVRGDARGLG